MKFVKKFVILFVVAILVGSSLIYFLWDNYQVRKDDMLLQEQQKIQSYFNSILSSNRVVSQIFFEQKINLPSVVSYLEQAYSADTVTKKDLRQSLYADLKPTFIQLQEKNIGYLRFYLANGENFLRLDDPGKFGDNLSQDDYSVRLLNEQRKYIEGFEVTDDYTGYRFIYPLFNQGRYVGGVEFGLSSHELYHMLGKDYSLTFNFLFSRELVGRKIDLNTSQNYFVSDLSNDYLYQRDSSSLKHVFTVSPEVTAAIDWQIKDKTSKELISAKPLRQTAVVDNINYYVIFTPISSIAERHLGFLVAYGMDSSVYLLRDALRIQYIVVISLFFIILFFVYYINESHSRLLNKTEELDDIAHTIGEGLLVIKRNKKILFFNAAAEELTGFLAEEVLDLPFGKKLKFVNEETEKLNDHFIEEAMRSRRVKVVSRDIALIHKQGHLIPLAVNAAPLLNKDNKVTGCIIVFRDVTREREIDRAKSEFVSLASHQLQTPLSAVSWHTEMLLDARIGQLNKKQKEFLHAIYEGNQRMIKLVNSLLNVSRIDMGTLSVNPKPTDIAKLTDNVLEELLFRVDIKELEITKDYGKLSKLKVDPQLMRIVLQNILSNAIKYSREKGKINISMSKDKENFMLAIQDHGYGIPKEQQPKIFSKLFRADNVKSRKVEGTGLGLYVAKSVIDAFGGKIWFKSQENKGTTFFITIPLRGVRAKDGSRTLEVNT